MASEKWGKISKYLPLIVYSYLIYLLLKPWFLFFAGDFFQFFSEYYFYSFFVLSTLISFALISSINGEEKVKKTIYLLLYFFLCYLIILWFNLPPEIFFLSFVLLFLLTLRYSLYFVNIDFNNDFIALFLFLVINVLLQRILGLQINFRDTLLFFAANICLAVYFNVSLLKKKGYQQDIKNNLRIMFIFLFVIIIITSLFTFILQGNILFQLLKIFYQAYIFVIGIIATPFIKILMPILSYILSLFDQSGDRSSNLEQIKYNLKQVEKEIQPEHVESGFPAYISWLIFLFLLILTIHLFSRYTDNERKEDNDVIIEERESVFSLTQLGEDIREVLSNLSKRFRNIRERRRYPEDNPLMVIRKIYYLLLLDRKKFYPFHLYYTPLEYLRKLFDIEEENNFRNIKELTGLYNRARYGENADERDAKRAREIWNKLKE